jgi:sterol desaturase/sphingolipid hydroxylase (fatty acid hydroxylase superfamily)
MSPIEKALLMGVLPFVVLSSLVEGWVLSRRQAYDWKAVGVSVLDLFLRLSINVFVPLALSTPVTQWAHEHRLMRLELDSWQTLLLLFVGQEFCYYWYHRAAHRVRWFWCNHAVHHSPNDLNLSAAYRIGIFGKITGTFLFFSPLVWLGFEPKLVMLTLTMNLLYQFWIHATWLPKLGWLEYVLNTPSAHRVHHASNPEYLDANFGGVLILFDRLFGTYVAERADLPPRYGLVKPITSYNPLRVEFTQWIELGRDMLKARSLKHVLGYLFMPPSWQPHDAPASTRAAGPAQAAQPPQA